MGNGGGAEWDVGAEIGKRIKKKIHVDFSIGVVNQ
jgi:hypothetical protein